MGGERDRRAGISYLYVLLVAAAALFVVSLVVDTEHVARWEIDLATWFNDAPSWFAHTLWPIMQLGTLWGPLVIGVIAAYVYGWRRGLAVAVAGVVAWFLAKEVKDIVERGRPLRYIPDVNVREGSGTGLGFVSGHTTVAFAIATALLPVLPRWGRVVAYAVATLVGIARIVYGAHLPLDVVGGACLGIMIGCAVDLVLAAVPPAKTA